MLNDEIETFSNSAFFFASLFGFTLNAIKIAFDALANVTSVSETIPISDKIIFGFTSSCFIWFIAFLIASEDPCTSDFIKKNMSGLLEPNVKEEILGSAEVIEIFKVSKIGKVAGSKVIEGEIKQDLNARLIRDGSVIHNGKINTIFREKDQVQNVGEGLECGITLKNYSDFQKKDIIEVFSSVVTERSIW